MNAARYLRSRQPVTAALVALSLSGCAAPATPSDDVVGHSAQAITAGVADDTTMSAIWIVVKTPKGTGFCSGVVVSPHVVLTAGHCASPDGEYSIFLGADYTDPAASSLEENLVAVTEHHPHPDYDADTNVNDIGVLVTATAIERTPAPINRTMMDPSEVGAPVRVVGYGKTAGGESNTEGRRHQGATTITSIGIKSVKVKGVPNICLFDSGGPTYMMRDGQEVVVGIHSVVDVIECNGVGSDVRVDPYADFVDGYIAASEPPAAEPSPDDPDESDTPKKSDKKRSAAKESSEDGSPAASSGCAVVGRNASSSEALVGVTLAAAIALLRRRGDRRRGSARARETRDRPRFLQRGETDRG